MPEQATPTRPLQLRDLGEARIVRDLIVPRFPSPTADVTGIGDDAAILPAPPPGHVLVATTDPCPTPVICLLEKLDYYHFGRLTAVVNISDLAAMGAKPLYLLVATVMPETMLVCEYERFLDGLADACKLWDCPIVGGNIKDGPDFTANGTALGVVRSDRVMRRTGAREGDAVLIIGEPGLFWAGVLARLRNLPSLPQSIEHALAEALYRPVARVREGQALASMGCVTSCMDSSDGVAACLFSLARANGADIVIDGDLTPHPAVAEVAERIGLDYRKLMCAWGNWELIITVPLTAVAIVLKAMQELGTPCRRIGQMAPGDGRVWVQDAGGRGLLQNFSSERFANTSMFTHGIQAYADLLMTAPLTRKPQ